MDLSTSSLIGLLGITVFLTALAWVLWRTLPRTRGRLRVETSSLDAPGRTVAAALLAGWGRSGALALAAGLATFLVLGLGSVGWSLTLNAAAQAPLEEQNTRYNEEYQACVLLESSGVPDAKSATDKCLTELVQPPAPAAVNDAVPVLLGYLAPVLGALAALGVLAWLASRRRHDDAGPGTATFAGLAPRGALSFGPRWALAIPALTTLFVCCWLVATGMTSSLDEFGRSTVLTVERFSVASDHEGNYVGPMTSQMVSVGNYPGWFVAVPGIAMALLLLALTAWLLRSFALTPRPTDPKLFAVDDLVRTLKARLVAALAGAGLLAMLGWLAIWTGGGLATLAGDMRLGADGLPEAFEHEWMLGGYWMALGGVVVGLLALLLLAAAIGAVLELSASRQVAVAVALGEEPENQPEGRRRG